MRKLLGTALALAFMLVACNDGQAPKIGVVDMNRLMRDSVPGKAGLKFIESQQTELQAALDKIQDRLEKNPGDENAVQELQKVYAASQQKIQAEGQGVVTKLFDAIQAAMDSYRRQNGYQILIRQEALDSYAPELDVTNAIMAEVDKLKLDFRPSEVKPENAASPAPDALGNQADPASSGSAEKQAGETPASPDQPKK